MDWHFKVHNGFDDVDQSSSSESFSGHAVRDLATALVREGIQNSIDARVSKEPEAEPVVVRLTLGSCEGEPEPCNRRWFGALMPHLSTEDVGAPNRPDISEPCSYLLFEDFRTKGLVGDYLAAYSPGEENNFVNFMYHDGITGKSDGNLGSRGIGKIVFTMASRARVVFAYTIRHGEADAKPLLVGKNLLKFRKVDGQLYGARSYFLQDWPEGSPRTPVHRDEATAMFRRDFALKRDREPGLSLAIPFLDESITADKLRHAIVSEYHYAILSGRLVVELDDCGRVETFDAQSLPRIESAEVNARVELARWAVSAGEPEHSTLPPESGQPQHLTEALLPEAVSESIDAALNQRERVAVRLPLYIHPKGADPVRTYLDMYLEYADRHNEKPLFIRDLLPVSDVREARRMPHVRALVVIGDEPLATLLRASEGANHTDWSPRTDKFQERYTGRRGEIGFVARSIHRLIELVRGQADEPVGGVATQFFSAVIPESKPVSRGKGKGQPGDEIDKVPEIEPKEREESDYIFSETADGFSIRHRPDRPLPGRLTVRVAYDVLRGSPWSQYDPADFDLRKKRGDVRILSSGADVARKDPGNRLVVSPSAEGFEVVATGFDPRRDLIIDHKRTKKTAKKGGQRDR